MFPGHSGVILEIKNMKIATENAKHLERNNTLLNNSWVKEKLQGESENIFKCMVKKIHIICTMKLKTSFRRKCITFNDYTRKEGFKTNY